MIKGTFSKPFRGSLIFIALVLFMLLLFPLCPPGACQTQASSSLEKLAGSLLNRVAAEREKQNQQTQQTQQGQELNQGPRDPFEPREPVDPTSAQGTSSSREGENQPAMDLFGGAGQSQGFTYEEKALNRINSIEQRIQRIQEKISENRARGSGPANESVTRTFTQDGETMVRPEFRTESGLPPSGVAAYEVVRDKEGQEGYYDQWGNYYRGIPRLGKQGRTGKETRQDARMDDRQDDRQNSGVSGSTLFPLGGSEGGSSASSSELFGGSQGSLFGGSSSDSGSSLQNTRQNSSSTGSFQLFRGGSGNTTDKRWLIRED